MTRRMEFETLWVFIASTLILIWGSIPTWAGYQAETQDLRFRGLHFDTQDFAVHLAMMEAGRQGETAYLFRFTTEPHNPAYLRLFYVALGHGSRLTSLPAETTYQLARWLFGYLALSLLYALMRKIFADPFWTRTAFLLAVMGSGLGWIQLLTNWTPGSITPIDFWLIDSYVFFSLSLFPHFAFVTAGMCLILLLWFQFLEAPRWQVVAVMAAMGILVQFTNPIALAPVDMGLAGAAFASWWKARRIRQTDVIALGVLAVLQMPLLAYNFIVLNNDPAWSQFTAQNQTLSPALIYYLLGFAPFLPFAAIGIRDLFHKRSNVPAAALLWTISGFALAYAPVFIQRRFLQNITIPLAILAVQGLVRLFDTRPAQSPWVKRWRTGLITLIIFAASISSIQLSLGRMVYIQGHPRELFYPAAIDEAIAWLADNARYNDFVLASEMTSQILAQKAGMRVYLGHEMETLGYADKQTQVASFFNGTLDEIGARPVQWVVYGPYEQAINPDFQPAGSLQLVFETDDLKIFAVK